MTKATGFIDKEIDYEVIQYGRPGVKNVYVVYRNEDVVCLQVETSIKRPKLLGEIESDKGRKGFLIGDLKKEQLEEDYKWEVINIPTYSTWHLSGSSTERGYLLIWLTKENLR